jgi:hypothetical protein
MFTFAAALVVFFTFREDSELRAVLPGKTKITHAEAQMLAMGVLSGGAVWRGCENQDDLAELYSSLMHPKFTPLSMPLQKGKAPELMLLSFPPTVKGAAVSLMSADEARPLLSGKTSFFLGNSNVRRLFVQVHFLAASFSKYIANFIEGGFKGVAGGDAGGVTSLRIMNNAMALEFVSNSATRYAVSPEPDMWNPNPFDLKAVKRSGKKKMWATHSSAFIENFAESAALSSTNVSRRVPVWQCPVVSPNSASIEAFIGTPALDCVAKDFSGEARTMFQYTDTPQWTVTKNHLDVMADVANTNGLGWEGVKEAENVVVQVSGPLDADSSERFEKMVKSMVDVRNTQRFAGRSKTTFYILGYCSLEHYRYSKDTDDHVVLARSLTRHHIAHLSTHAVDTETGEQIAFYLPTTIGEIDGRRQGLVHEENSSWHWSEVGHLYHAQVFLHVAACAEGIRKHKEGGGSGERWLKDVVRPPKERDRLKEEIND